MITKQKAFTAVKKQLLCTAIIALAAISAKAYQVKAVLADATGEGLPYVTYRLYNATDSLKAIVSDVTDDFGALDHQIAAAGDYRIEFSYVGMATRREAFSVSPDAPVADLGTITLSEASEQLQGITVTAQRPLVVRQIDRIAYDVQADPATPTSTLQDVMRKVPMVTVDADGTIRVNGSTSFKIYKNGRPNNSMSRNAKDLFAALPASMIKRIEVITEPGAEYDAEGTTAILNIITNSNASIKGVLGNVALRYDTQCDYPGLNTWITSEIDKVTFNVYGGFQDISERSTKTTTTNRFFYPDGSERDQDSFSKFHGNLGFFGFDASYQPDTLNLFTAELSGYAYGINGDGNGFDQLFASNGALASSYRTNILNSKNSYVDFNAAFNYQHNTHRPGEKFTLSYLLSHTNQDTASDTYYLDCVNFSLPYTANIADYNLKFFEHTIQGDYSRQLGIHTLNFGIKGILRNNHSQNNFDYVGYRPEDLEFKHNTSIAAVYGQYTVRLNKVMLRAGLRYEYSHLEASYPDGSGNDYSSDLNDVVPSAAISWQVDDANSLSFNYSTSISRPGISYLNPATIESPSDISYGNPDLGSAARRSMKLNYSVIKRSFNVNFSVNYAMCNNGIAAVKFLDDNHIVHSTYDNIGHSRSLSFNLYTRWSITPKTNFMINANADYNRFTQTGMELNRWTYSAFFRISQTLPADLEVGLIAWTGNGWAGDVYSYISRPFYSGMYGIELRRSFLKENRLQVMLQLRNPIKNHTDVSTSHIVNGDYTGYSTTSRHNPMQLSVGISYRFGNLRAQVRKTDTTITNDDLIGRK